jgi:DNA repair photolyase
MNGSEGWFGTTHNMNIYKGCNQGCIYCDSRSSCYQIKDFDTIKPKLDAPIKIDKELSNKRRHCVISMGGMSDPYNHLEEHLEYTKQALQSILKYGHGVSIITKNTRVLRDIDLLKQINQNSEVTVGITITTANDLLQSRIERNVSSTSERFDAIKTLSDQGIYTGVLMMPILPFINDTVENITSIVEKAHESGAKFIYPSFGVTLRDNQRMYFFEKIGKDLTQKYIDEYKDDYICVSKNVEELKKHFNGLCRKYGILYKMKDIVLACKGKVKNQQITLEL